MLFFFFFARYFRSIKIFSLWALQQSIKLREISGDEFPDMVPIQLGGYIKSCYCAIKIQRIYLDLRILDQNSFCVS